MIEKNFISIRVVQAIAFLTIPIIFFFVNGNKFEQSISLFAYTIPIAFATCLTFAVALFIYDGVVDVGNYYNTWIGGCLLGVVIFGCKEYFILHYMFAVMFFLGSFVNMIIFSSKKFRKSIILATLFVILGMISSLMFGGDYKILLLEIVGMFPISFYLAFKALGKIY
tara:strand:- start:3815 stop:4318 length:504 start_codon:yes stop_codon:yes gene_type:complete